MSYERQDASLRMIGIAMVLLLVGLAGSLGASAWWYSARGPQAGASHVVLRQTSFTNGPAAEPDIARQRREVLATAEQRLRNYAWVDRDGGIAQIPIDRAIELVIAGVKPAPAPRQPGDVP